MIKVRHRVFGHQRDCPSQACADKMLSTKKHGEYVWELASNPVKMVDKNPKRKYGEPVKKETLKQIIEQEKESIVAKPSLEQVDIDEAIEVDELVELRERYQAQKGKKPHWKMNKDTLRKELGDEPL